MYSLWLYLHFPHLQLDTLSSSFEDFYGVQQPLIILSDKNNKVVQLNPQADAVGIRLGMGLGSAAALSHDLLVHPYKTEIEQSKLAEISEHLYQVTSDICLFPPDGLLLRIHNMLQLYSDLPTYWQALKNQLQQVDVTYHFATGYSPYMARLLAKNHWDKITQQRQFMYQQASRCSLKHTELSSKIINKLHRVGVDTVGDLLKLSLKDIAKRFDIELVTYLGRLTGEFQHKVAFYHPADSFHRYLELMYEIENSEVLVHPLQRLLNALEQFLKLRDQLTHELHIKLHHREDDDVVLTIGSAQGEYKAQSWLHLLQLKLQEVQLAAPVYALTLTTGKTHIRAPQRQDLFVGQQGNLSNLQLISLLQAKLGDQAIHGLTLNDDFRPEYSAQYCSPLVTNALTPQFSKTRPSFLLKSAQPLREKVSIVHGPERLNTGWWDASPVIRDYFVARSKQGKWYWVYRTPNSEWYLHGVFS